MSLLLPSQLLTSVPLTGRWTGVSYTQGTDGDWRVGSVWLDHFFNLRDNQTEMNGILIDPHSHATQFRVRDEQGKITLLNSTTKLQEHLIQNIKAS